MFKRVFAIFLCVIAFCFGVIPVSAAPTNAYWIDGLAYGGANGVGRTVWSVPAGQSISFWFPLPDNTTVRSLDLVFRFGHSDFTIDFSLEGGSDAEKVIVSDRSTDFGYLATCQFQVPYYTDRINVTFRNTGTSTTNFNILNLRVCTSLKPYYNLSGVGVSVHDDDFGDYSRTYSGKPVTMIFPTGTQERQFAGYLSVPFDSWINYEKIAFNFAFICGSLSSFNGAIGDGLPVSTDVTFFDNSVSGGAYFVTVTVDLTEIVKSNFTDLDLKINFSGVFEGDVQNSVSVQSAYGFLSSGNSDNSDNRFFAYWFGVIRDWFSDLFSGLGSWFSSLFRNLSAGFQSVVDAIVGDTADNEAMESEAASQDQALGDLNSALNGVEKPDPGSIDMDIDIDPDGLNFISGGLSGIYQSSVFSQILSIVSILGLAGFVFFGKR